MEAVEAVRSVDAEAVSQADSSSVDQGEREPEGESTESDSREGSERESVSWGGELSSAVGSKGDLEREGDGEGG
jgi:hypothetical protein